MREISEPEALNEELFDAVIREDVAAARSALENGASGRYERSVQDSSGCDTIPALFVACQKKNRALIERLLAHGADPNVPLRVDAMISEEKTCLIAVFPSVELAALLLESGADPNKPDWWKENHVWPTYPLEAAHDEQLEALLRRHRARKPPRHD